MGDKGECWRERVGELNAETLSTQRRGLRGGIAEVSSINHDPCYHGLNTLSNTFVVLVVCKVAHLCEGFCKEKKTKG
jgi:hypothetical protein